MSIPTVTLTCLAGVTGAAAPCSADEIEIADMRVTPPETVLNELITRTIIGLAKRYVFQEKPAQEVVATLTFSAKDALTFSHSTPPALIDLYKQFKGDPFVLPVIPETEEQIRMLKQMKKPDNFVPYLPLGYKGKKLVYIEPISLLLFQQKIVAPITLKVNIFSLCGNRYGPTCTGGFRFPHLLKAAMDKYSHVLDSPNTKICIAGPGLRYGKSPQVTEFYALFPKASFLLLDNDVDLLTKLKTQLGAGCMFYDLGVFRVRQLSLKGKEETLATPPSYLPLFQRMEMVFKSKAKNPKDHPLVEGDIPLKHLLLNVDRANFEVRKFDFGTSTFHAEELGTYDMVIGTLSIASTVETILKNSSVEDALACVQKFLELLKDGGTLYVDSFLLELHFPKDPIIWKPVEVHLTSTLTFEEIPFGDLLPAITKRASIISFSLEDFAGTDKKSEQQSSLTTTYVTAITRKYV